MLRNTDASYLNWMCFLLLLLLFFFHFTPTAPLCPEDVPLLLLFKRMSHRSCQAWNDQSDTESASLLHPLTSWPWSAACQLLLSSHLTATPAHLFRPSNPRKPRHDWRPTAAPVSPRSSIIIDRQASHFTSQLLTSSQHVGCLGSHWCL